MSTVHVLAIITTKLGQREAVLEKFNANVPAVLAEDGCIAYEATIDADGAGPIQTPAGVDTFVVVEKWASLEALAAHGASAHMKAYAESTKDMVADRVIHVLSPS
ncbi:putative quinol monooxygenase [Fluviibacterium sp. DFM31]|uniref:Quinol monooxygenase n=1 Tax=Meridianimarinicoccus marinus TaxID=3231483 RepID=A0ABV3LAY9_9RHOB